MKYMIIEPEEPFVDALRAHNGFYDSRQAAIADARRIACGDFYVIPVPRLLKKQKPKRGPLRTQRVDKK